MSLTAAALHSHAADAVLASILSGRERHELSSAPAQASTPSIAASIRAVGADQAADQSADIQDIPTLQAMVADLSATNERVMAQNLSLLSDVEKLADEVRTLRQEKAVLAAALEHEL